MEPVIGGGTANTAEALIKDSDTATFMQDVVEASQTRPVIVDFWAPWCGPCKQLTPILEKAVQDANGAVALVKINIDENQQIAQQLRIQSIPAVFVFKDGQPVDGFVGAQPESQIKALIERVAGPVGPSPAEQILDMAGQAMEAGDIEGAAQAYGQLLQQDQSNPGAIAGLAKCYLRLGDMDRAKQVLALTPPEHQDHADIAAARAALALEEKSESVGDLAPLEEKLAADPADHQARFDLAVALAAKGEKQQAADHLLEIIRRERSWNDDAARKQLLSFFEMFGATDPVTIEARRNLSSILFA
ncbi:MAG TPA: thioredoxin [Alphaproteobacteria bacterium]|nr:thioredoxin [Alphaproteobacteria bacterium]HBA42705.1 thioredoxin [Alphaproteobacteria bacterium]HBC53630.1 thioredoxin [Alphaproteobacteria bacterium]